MSSKSNLSRLGRTFGILFLDVYLRQCYKPEELNVQCPVCSKPFNDLVKPLPFAHCSQSYLICTLSGKPMDEHNPPMALPNGYVYGEQVTRFRRCSNPLSQSSGWSGRRGEGGGVQDALNVWDISRGSIKHEAAVLMQSYNSQF